MKYLRTFEYKIYNKEPDNEYWLITNNEGFEEALRTVCHDNNWIDLMLKNYFAKIELYEYDDDYDDYVIFPLESIHLGDLTILKVFDNMKDAKEDFIVTWDFRLRVNKKYNTWRRVRDNKLKVFGEPKNELEKKIQLFISAKQYNL